MTVVRSRHELPHVGAGIFSLLGSLQRRNDRYLQLINNDVALTLLIQGNHLGTQDIVSENNRG